MVKKCERKEVWIRIFVGIISSIVLNIWGFLINIVLVINAIITLFAGERNKALAEFCEPWNTETYKLMRYTTFMSNKRPFPFSKIERISKFK